MSYRIYQFSRPSGEGEYLVISDLPEAEVIKEFKRPDVQLDDTYTIVEENASGLPCDRELTHELS